MVRGLQFLLGICELWLSVLLNGCREDVLLSFWIVAASFDFPFTLYCGSVLMIFSSASRLFVVSSDDDR